MSTEESVSTMELPNPDFQARDLKRKNALKFFYPFVELSSALSYGISSYVMFFLTNVYLLSVTFSTITSVVSSLAGLIVLPVFAGFLDRLRFKKSKFWPWIVIGTVALTFVSIAVMSLPALGFKDPTTLAPLVFLLRLLGILVTPLRDVPVAGVFPLLSSEPRDRAFFARSQKVGRDIGKTIGGYVVPALLIGLTALSGSEMSGYMYTAFIAYGTAMIGFMLLALFGLRGSYVEREALVAGEKAKEAKIPITATLKAVVTNRPLYGMFLFFVLHKVYFFLYASYATYVFEYVYEDFSKLGLFYSAFSFAAVIGVLAGAIWGRFFKESKRSFVAAMIAHVIITAIIAVFFKGLSANFFLVLFAASCFFMGMLENWILPMFAASADFGAWKTGIRSDSLVMSVFSLSFTPAFALPPIIAAVVLNSVNYTEFVASGAAATPEIVNAIGTLFSWIPLVISLMSLACLVFVFNLNDTRIKAIQDELAAGNTKATTKVKIF